MKFNFKKPNIKKPKFDIKKSKFNFNTRIKFTNLSKPAPIKMQQTWRNMPQINKNVLKKLLPDSDRDGVPNGFDCQPFNPKKQDDDLAYKIGKEEGMSDKEAKIFSKFMEKRFPNNKNHAPYIREWAKRLVDCQKNRKSYCQLADEDTLQVLYNVGHLCGKNIKNNKKIKRDSQGREMKTLGELKKEGAYIVYGDVMGDDEFFVETEIINPENEQSLSYAWVPKSMVNCLEFEREIKNTDRYYRWTSELKDEIKNQKFSSEREAKHYFIEKVKEIAKKYNVNGNYPGKAYRIINIDVEKYEAPDCYDKWTGEENKDCQKYYYIDDWDVECIW